MQVGDDTQVPGAVMRNDLLAVKLRQRADLAKGGHAVQHHALRLEHVIDSLLAHPQEFVQSGVVLAARDWHFNGVVQLGQPVEVETRKRLFQPVAVEVLKLPGGVHGPAEVPLNAGLPGAAGLGLVAVDHDLHGIAHGFPDRLHKANVLRNRLEVGADFDGFPPFLLQLDGHLGAFLGRGKQDHAGIGNYLVSTAAPELVQGLTRRLADKVPQGDVDTGGAQVWRTRGVVTQHVGVTLDIEGVLSQQPLPDGRNQARWHTGTDADQTLVRVNLNE